MNCEMNLCTQGRQPCPTPWTCNHGLHRVTLTADEVETAEYAEAQQITMEDDSITPLVIALYVGGAVLVVGVVLLPFVFGVL